FYDDTKPDLMFFQTTNNNYKYLNDSRGEITVYSYSANPSLANGYLQSIALRHGEMGALSSGSEMPQTTIQYTSHTIAAGPTVYPLATQAVYRTDGGADPAITSYVYDWHAGTNQPKFVEVTLPSVATTQNGPGAASAYDRSKTYFDTYGRPTWSKDALG